MFSFAPPVLDSDLPLIPFLDTFNRSGNLLGSSPDSHLGLVYNRMFNTPAVGQTNTGYLNNPDTNGFAASVGGLVLPTSYTLDSNIELSAASGSQIGFFLRTQGVTDNFSGLFVGFERLPSNNIRIIEFGSVGSLTILYDNTGLSIPTANTAIQLDLTSTSITVSIPSISFSHTEPTSFLNTQTSLGFLLSANSVNNKIYTVTQS